MRRKGAGFAPAAHSFLSCQKTYSAPFSLRGKEKAAGGKKKTAKGEFRISPFANPLKTTKKGAAAPFLGFFPEFGLCGDRFRSAKRATDAYWTDRRGSRNTLRLFRMRPERKFASARCATLPLQKDGLSTFIRQIFNGREQNDSHCVSCAWETRSGGRPKGVPCGMHDR